MKTKRFVAISLGLMMTFGHITIFSESIPPHAQEVENSVNSYTTHIDMNTTANKPDESSDIELPIVGFEQSDAIEVIHFANEDYEGLTDLEIGIAKVNQYSLREDASDHLSEETLIRIGQSDMLTRSHVYAIEDSSDNPRARSSNTENSVPLVSVSKDQYDQEVKIRKQVADRKM